MKVFEVKNNTAEILYTPLENNLFLADFLFIEDDNVTIVSQVTDIASANQENLNIATVKFYLTVDKNNRLKKYNGYTPSKNSQVGFLDADEIIRLFRPKTKEIVWGNYVRNPELPVATDLKFLSSNNCIICDKAQQAISIVKNLVFSLNKAGSRILLLDFEGKYKSVKTSLTAVFGLDYKIPLDSKALDYIFEKDLDDCPIDAKAIIQGIILEIQKYVESLPKGFLPFELFVNIIAQECKNSDNSGLLIFYNKLLQYKQKKIFAEDESQFETINNSIGSFKLDVSDIDTKYHNLILSSVISHINKKVYVISDVSEENLTNDTVKKIYENETVRLIPIINHEDKFLNKIKSYCKNLTVFASDTAKYYNEDFGFFIPKLSRDEFILWGESTLFIPLIVISNTAEDINNLTYSSINNDEITIEDLDNLDAINFVPEIENSTAQKTDNAAEFSKSAIIENNMNTLDNSNYSLASDIPDKQQNIDNDLILNDYDEQLPIIDAYENNIKDISHNSQSLSINEQTLTLEEQLENLASEQNNHSVSESKIQIEEVSNEETYSVNNELADSSNLKIKEQSSDKTNKQNNLSETNNNSVTKNNNRNIPDADKLPIYEPKEKETDNSQNFDEGNRVFHAKYGEGTIEKIIVYGNKRLCSIQFDNVGRRLLDPKITTLHKV